jgi:hypothetical protein
MRAGSMTFLALKLGGQRFGPGPGDARAAFMQPPLWMGGHYRGVTVTSQTSA